MRQRDPGRLGNSPGMDKPSSTAPAGPRLKGDSESAPSVFDGPFERLHCSKLGALLE
jgi:hypothetical protein